MPLPEEDTYDAIEQLFKQLNSIHTVLSDPDITSIRLVLNLEKMVIKETQRAYTYLNLYGYPVDSVIVNRTMPIELDHPFFKEWRKFQDVYREEIGELFNEIPIYEAPLSSREVLGTEALTQFGETLFPEEDPVKVFFRGKPYEIVKEGNMYSLVMTLPFVTKEELKLHQVERGASASSPEWRK